jgi:tetratricopeptide (TPR) repeat protein
LSEQEASRAIREGIRAVKQQEYMTGLTLLSGAYSTGSSKMADGLSYYGLALALVEKKYKAGIEFCRKAIELQFYHGDHYANLARVYVAAGNRKKAVETINEGLRVHPDDADILKLKREIGERSAPVVPFLSRDNPLNVALGRARHAREVKAAAKKKRRSSPAEEE